MSDDNVRPTGQCSACGQIVTINIRGTATAHLAGLTGMQPICEGSERPLADDNLDTLIAEGRGFTGNGVTDRLVAALVSVRAELVAAKTEALLVDSANTELGEALVAAQTRIDAALKEFDEWERDDVMPKRATEIQIALKGVPA